MENIENGQRDIDPLKLVSKGKSPPIRLLPLPTLKPQMALPYKILKIEGLIDCFITVKINFKTIHYRIERKIMFLKNGINKPE